MDGAVLFASTWMVPSVQKAFRWCERWSGVFDRLAVSEMVGLTLPAKFDSNVWLDLSLYLSFMSKNMLDISFYLQ